MSNAEPREGDLVETLPSGTQVLYRDSSHRYWLIEAWDEEEGTIAKKRPLNAVSSILRILDKPALIESAVRLAFEGKHYRTEWGAAATRGTSIHKALERLASEGQVPDLNDFPEEDQGFVRALSGWWLEAEPEVIQTEFIVASERYSYAGRCDLRCRLDGRELLVDLKTVAKWSLDKKGNRRPPYKENALQLAAYECALEESGYAPVDATAVLRLEASGEYDLIEGWAKSFHFLTIQRAHRTLKALDDLAPKVAA